MVCGPGGTSNASRESNFLESRWCSRLKSSRRLFCRGVPVRSTWCLDRSFLMVSKRLVPGPALRLWPWEEGRAALRSVLWLSRIRRSWKELEEVG